MKARSLYLLGDLSGARDGIGQMLDRYVPPAKRSHIARFQYDQRVLARITLARVLWLQGYADRALREIVDTVEMAGSIHHTSDSGSRSVRRRLSGRPDDWRSRSRRTIYRDAA